MCNNIHWEHQAISKKGFGYKIFHSNGDACFIEQSYRKTNGWIRWERDLRWGGDGFCFFLTQREARFILNTWKENYADNDNLNHAVKDPADRIIRKIEYADGICKQYENAMIDGIEVTMALCKKWRLVPAKPRRA